MSNPSAGSGSSQEMVLEVQTHPAQVSSASTLTDPAPPGKKKASVRRRGLPIALVVTACLALISLVFPASPRQPGRVGSVLANNGFGLLPLLIAGMLLVALSAILFGARWLAVLTGIVGMLMGFAVLVGIGLVSFAGSSLGVGLFEFWGPGWWLLGALAIVSLMLSTAILARKK
ncbi:hypothetical protein U6G28_01885 [Actinomycetaceae bacterium MB13-C1-2]|nr:hypothetical protein U6G28_01885 [Actinomycetaceae bacterium MB13-C1-2]